MRSAAEQRKLHSEPTKAGLVVKVGAGPNISFFSLWNKRTAGMSYLSRAGNANNFTPPD